MATTYLAPDPIQSMQFIPGGIVPANGGLLFFYAAGSSTKTTVYKDNLGVTPWTNPIVLDSGGNLPLGGEVWFQGGVVYKVVFAPFNDTDPPASPYWTKDNLSGINDVASSISALEWIVGPAPTFVSTTSFTVPGDQTGAFTQGRRIKTTNTGGTVYSTIFKSTFAATLTTVVVVNDSGVLDAGLSAVAYALLSSTNESVPLLPGGRSLFMDPTDRTKQVSISASTIPSSTTINLNVPTTSGTIALAAQLLPLISVVQYYIQGFQISNNTATSSSMDIGPGSASDFTNSFMMSSAGIVGKTQAAFSTGASTGAKLSAAAFSTNTWYAWYALMNSSATQVDFGFDLQFPTTTGVYSPTTTAAFPFFRYIGGRKSSSTSTWMSAIQHGDDVRWASATSHALDYASNFSFTVRTLVNVNCPPSIVQWYGVVEANDGTGAGTSNAWILTDPSQPDVGVVTNAMPFGNFLVGNGGGAIPSSVQFGSLSYCWTALSSTSPVTAQLGLRGINAIAANMGTWGWIDPRGKPS